MTSCSRQLLAVLSGLVALGGCALTPREIRQRAGVLPVEKLLAEARQSQAHKDAALQAVMQSPSRRCDPALIARLLALGANPTLALPPDPEVSAARSPARLRQTVGRSRRATLRRRGPQAPQPTPFTVAVRHCGPAEVKVFLAAGVALRDFPDITRWPIEAIRQKLWQVDTGRPDDGWRQAWPGDPAVGVLKVLLEAGADPNLIPAVLNGGPRTREERFALVRLLIAHGADVNRGDLVNAALTDRATVQFLLSAGLRLAPCKDAPPLHQALTRCYEGQGSRYCDMARFLLEHGANPRCAYRAFRDREKLRGETPLHLAAAYADPGMVRLLLERGADPTARDGRFGETPLHRALGPNGLRVRWHNPRRPAPKPGRRLPPGTRSHGAAHDPAVQAIAAKQVEVARLLLDRGADPSAARRDRPWLTPLYRALHMSCAPALKLRLVRMLLDNGTNLSLRDGAGQGPLHWALTAGGAGPILPLVQLLLENGVDPTVKDRSSVTPADLAQRTQARHGKQVLKVLRVAAGLE